jgi:acyl-CoA thioester hydrolase
MPRVKIKEPLKYIHDFDITIRVSDLNYGNHLGNDRILTFAQEARVDYLASHAKSELDFWGVSLIQGDAAIVYKSEGFLNEILKIEIGISDLSNSSFDIVYKMTNLSSNKILAFAKTRMVCFDYDTRKVVGLPEDFKNLVD